MIFLEGTKEVGLKARIGEGLMGEALDREADGRRHVREAGGPPRHGGTPHVERLQVERGMTEGIVPEVPVKAVADPHPIETCVEPDENRPRSRGNRRLQPRFKRGEGFTRSKPLALQPIQIEPAHGQRLGNRLSGTRLELGIETDLGAIY